MVANVVFHEFGHEAVDGSVCALFIVIEGAQNSLQLSGS
jgi:hypothetical protein